MQQASTELSNVAGPQTLSPPIATTLIQDEERAPAPDTSSRKHRKGADGLSMTVRSTTARLKARKNPANGE